MKPNNIRNLSQILGLKLLSSLLMTYRQTLRLVIVVTAIICSGMSAQAWAQNLPATGIGEARKFPDKSKLGELVIGVFPEASLNGQPTRFSASGRLINLTNMIVLPSSVYQQTLVVRYELDTQGNINRAWLLNPAELKIAHEQARNTP
jgi:hypothetical protein